MNCSSYAAATIKERAKKTKSGDWSPDLQISRPEKPICNLEYVLPGMILWQLSARFPYVLFLHVSWFWVRWTKEGAQQLLQVRIQVLNNTLRETFCRWYPHLSETSSPLEQEVTG